jgi:[protein-PII] uridylyltransferase
MRSIAFLMDQLVRLLYDVTTTQVYPVMNRTAGEHIAVVAVGGYGRGELAPGSDLDLLFLLPYKQTPWGEQCVEFMLYLLWDLGLKVGHATRSVADCVRLAKADLTIRTALLEARYLWGDQPLFVQLKKAFRKEVTTGTGPQFAEAKLAERDERHRRLGDSRYVLEPNVKEGKGGLRDLQTLYWIAKYVYQVEDVADLVDAGVLTAAERRRFAKAENFLATVRCHLHYRAGRPEERLTFDAQADIAARLGYTDHAGTRGVERFMKHYFLVAKDVGDLTRIFCAAIEDQHKRKSRLRLPRLGLRRREVDGFIVDGDRITIAGPRDFKDDPVKLIRLFQVAQARDLDIHPQALRQITRDLRLIDGKMREDPEANRLFVDILAHKRNPEVTLRRMNEAGVFGRFVPDFGRVVAQMQHDMYHVYTVDEHTIRAIGLLARIEAGELADDHPMSAQIIKKVANRRVLYLAVLLHDIAKGRGGDHSILGAEVAEKLAPRLGYDAAETELVAWLVRYHLAMSSTAFKRDLDDRKTIEDFVELVQSPERLRLLLLLTVADIRAVGPNVWNGWKGQLLRQLFHRAEEHMLGTSSESTGAERVQRLKDELRKRLKKLDRKALAHHLERGPDSFWLAVDVDMHEQWARLIVDADAAGRKLTVEARVHEFQSVTEVTVYTTDHAGLFARLSGAMTVSGANILDARIFTTSDGMALDVFWVQDDNGEPIAGDAALKRLAKRVEQVMSGEIRLSQALKQRRGKLPTRARVFTVEPLIVFDNEASNTHTVIEVNARDRPALLHDLTRAFFDLSLTIAHARIATYGERAVDVFYVKDLFGMKVTHPGKRRAIETRLRQAIEKGAEPVKDEAKAASKGKADKKPEPARARRPAA